MVVCLQIEEPGEKPKNWFIRCGEVFCFELDGDEIVPIVFTTDHPLLWEFKQETAVALFSGVATNVPAAVGALYEAHEGAVAGWHPIRRYLHADGPISNLLSSGGGKLASGPVEVLKAYENALAPYGIVVTIGSRIKQAISDEWAQRINVLLLGNSYIVGAEWTTDQIRAKI